MCNINRGFEPKEMHRVWRTGALIEDFENFDSYDDDLDADGLSAAATAHASARALSVPTKPIDVIIPTNLADANRQSSALGKGKLTQLLSKERKNRFLSVAPATSSSRFRGVFQRTVGHTQSRLPSLSASDSVRKGASLGDILSHASLKNPGGDSSDEETTGDQVKCHMQTAKILRNPFATASAAIPRAAPVKRNKKNLTFALVRHIYIF